MHAVDHAEKNRQADKQASRQASRQADKSAGIRWHLVAGGDAAESSAPLLAAFLALIPVVDNQFRNMPRETIHLK